MTKLDIRHGKSAGAQFSLAAGGAKVNTHGNPIPYFIPWLLGFALLGLAMGVRYGLARDEFAWFWSAFVLLVYGALTAGAWLTSRARGKLTHALAPASVAFAGLWTWYVGGTATLTWRPIVVYLGGMLVFCGIGNMLLWLRNSPDAGGGMHEKVRTLLDKVRNMNEVRVVDGQVVGQIEVQPGETIEDTRRELVPVLASIHDAPAGAVSITPSRGESVRRGTFRIAPDDRLAEPTPYPGPSLRPGEGTLLDPVRFGVRRSGPLQIWLPGDARVNRNASLIMATGMPGAGKSELIRLLLLDALARPGFEYDYLNPRKADQEPDWVLGGARKVARTKDECIDALAELYDESNDVSAWLGKRGFDQWTPECFTRYGFKFRLVIGDEAAGFAMDAEDVIVNLAETVRSLGRVPLLGFQRASHGRVPTDARNLFGTHICLGVDKAEDAGMALAEETLAAGAEPERWGNREPGMCYVDGPGIPMQQWAEDARTYAPNKRLMAQWGDYLIDWQRRNGATVLPSADVPEQHGGELVPTGAAGHVVEARPARGFGEPVDDQDDEFDDDQDDVCDDEPDDNEDHDGFEDASDAELVDDVIRLAKEGAARDGTGPDPEAPPPKVPADCAEVHDIDPREEIEVHEGGGMDLRLSPKMPPAEARTFARSYLLKLREQGVTRFEVKDVAEEILYQTGMSARWLSKWVGVWSGDRSGDVFLREVPPERSGVYEFVTRALPPGGDAS